MNIRNRAMNGYFQEALTLDAIRTYAPSAFAQAAHESRSSRYTYIPTSEVITGLMAQGFQPFKAAQTAAELRREFTARIFDASSADNMNLLAFMVAHAVEDYAQDFLTFWGVTPTEEETEESGGEAFDRLLDYLAGLSGKEQTAAIFDMLLYSAGECDAYNYRVSPTVAKAAQLYGVNVEEVETRVRRGIMAEQAPQIPQEQPARFADIKAAAEPGSDATPSLEDPEDRLDEPEMPELQDAEDATDAADGTEEQPAPSAEAAQDPVEEPAEAQETEPQEEVASDSDEAEEQPVAGGEAVQNPVEEPVEAQETEPQEEVVSASAEAEEQPVAGGEAVQNPVEEPVEAQETEPQEEVASASAEAEEQPVAGAEADHDDAEAPAEAPATLKQPKPRGRAGQGSSRSKRAATTPPAKATKKRSAKA